MCPVHIPPDGLPPASPMIISETESHIIVAVEIAKTTLARHGRFIENLLAVATSLRRIENDE
jgi:hypothetical protein